MASDNSELLLTPRNDVGIGGVQKELLNDAFESPQACNIAITGPFGSGKSSVVKSYEKLSARHFAYVSLADFAVSKGCVLETAEGKSSTYLLERKVIDQLSARTEPTETIRWDKTRYPTAKVSRNRRSLSMGLIACIVLIASAIVLCAQAMNRVELLGVSAWMPLAIAAVWIVILTVSFATWYVKSGCPPLVRKVSFEGTSAELEAGTNNGSFFDEHLSFIIELFDSRKDDAYVFEDMDRSNNEEIFVRLRELNLILNGALKKGSKPIRFIYCLGDDVFLDEGRTKFFDIMIPVVPVLDGYNSYGGLVELLGREADRFDLRFLKNIAMYVDDYRLLKAIVTDYLVYRDILVRENTDAMAPEKLMAMAAVKNIAPKVFLDLQRRRGDLYQLLSEPQADSGASRLDDAEIIRKAAERAILSSDEDKTLPNRTIQGSGRAVGLIVYLVESAYIDEGFFFYMSRPDSEGPSTSDRLWLMSARNGSQDTKKELDDPEKVYAYMQPHEFEHQKVFNISLLRWMLDHISPEERSLSNLIGATSDRDSSFARTAVVELPKFPLIASRIEKAYFSAIEGMDDSLFVLSLMGGLQGSDELSNIDSANDGRVKRAIERCAGSYGQNTIARYNVIFQDIIPAISASIILLDARVKTISQSADQELIMELARKHLYVQSKDNCLVVLRFEGLNTSENANPLDIMYGTQSSLAWKNVEGDPDLFVSDYLANQEELFCMEGAFLELINLCSKTSSKERLIDAYGGTIKSLKSIDDHDVWSHAVSMQIILKSQDNAFLYLETIGVDAIWIEYANELDTFSIGDNVPTSAFKPVIRDNVVLCDKLEDRQYRALVSLLEKHSLKAIPRGIPQNKKRILFDLEVVELNMTTIVDMRSTFEDETPTDYIAGAIDEYISCVNRSSGQDQEVSKVLACGHPEVQAHVDSLVKCLRGTIALVGGHSDAVLCKLIQMNKLSPSSHGEALSRYGRNSELNTVLPSIVKNVSKSELETRDIDARLLADAIPRCNQQKQREIIGSMAKRPWKDVAAVLKAFNNSHLTEIANGKQPVASSLDADARNVVDVLLSIGRASVSINGRVYPRQSVPKRSGR